MHTRSCRPQTQLNDSTQLIQYTPTKRTGNELELPRFAQIRTAKELIFNGVYDNSIYSTMSAEYKVTSILNRWC